MRYPEDVAITWSDRLYKREQERIRAWHRTRDAALTGLLARGGFGLDAVDEAALYAGAAHGPLVSEEKP